MKLCPIRVFVPLTVASTSGQMVQQVTQKSLAVDPISLELTSDSESENRIESNYKLSETNIKKIYLHWRISVSIPTFTITGFQSSRYLIIQYRW
jgi:hypothetical protein